MDLAKARLLVFGELAGGEYQRRVVVERSERRAAAIMPHISVELSALFGWSFAAAVVTCSAGAPSGRRCSDPM